ELQKQRKEQDFITLLNIIGKLSNELTIENPLQLVFDETLAYLMSLLKTKDNHFDSSSYQWDKASAILGIPLPEIKDTNIPMAAISKTMIDAIYFIPFRDFFKLFGKDDSPEQNYQTLAEKLNFDLANRPGVRSDDLIDLFNEEFQGAIDACSSTINAALAHYIKWHYNLSPSAVKLEEIKQRGLINMFPNLFRFGKIENYFPSLQIHSGLHASFRYDKAKKFKQNDFYDFQHAASALPYCDYFITDNPLAQRLINKPLEFDKRFRTKVLAAKPELILQAFNNILLW
ncbi:MAG: hypothetical protein P4N41_08115, partial [Negativicutes bacterium]|nr:hypothetical protein [Negativicutes bacterium]